MRNKISKSSIAVFVLFVFVLVRLLGQRRRSCCCLQPVQAGFRNSVSMLPASNVAPEVKAQQADTSDLVVSVGKNIEKIGTGKKS